MTAYGAPEPLYFLGGHFSARTIEFLGLKCDRLGDELIDSQTTRSIDSTIFGILRRLHILHSDTREQFRTKLLKAGRGHRTNQRNK